MNLIDPTYTNTHVLRDLCTLQLADRTDSTPIVHSDHLCYITLQPPLGTRRTIVLSGMLDGEVIEVVSMYRESCGLGGHSWLPVEVCGRLQIKLREPATHICNMPVCPSCRSTAGCVCSSSAQQHAEAAE